MRMSAFNKQNYLELKKKHLKPSEGKTCFPVIKVRPHKKSNELAKKQVYSLTESLL